MACVSTVCGTGGWTGPLPGDPGNDSLISAVGVIGGIEVSWTYPNLNPHAVSYGILYRGLSANFAGAVQKALVGGSTYFDRIPDEEYREYFYWLRIVSINGTTGELIGPAAAHPLGLIENIIQGLTGQIDAGVLATALRTKIDRISIISGELEGETAERIAAHAAFSAALNAVQSDADQALTFISNEVTARTSADTAIVTSVNSLAAGVGDNAAAIIAQQTVSAAADAALANDISLLYSRVAAADAAVVTETTARTAADAALANQITTAQTTLNGQIASAQTTLQTEINTTNGRVTNIGARWTAVVDVNGMVGGFGVYNNGAFVEAGFDVDRFWIGRTVNKKKPFIIDGTTVYIDSACIANAAIDNAKIANAAITYAKIADAQIGWAKIANAGIQSAHIADAQITNAKISNLAVDTLKIANAAVTSFSVIGVAEGTTPVYFDFIPYGWSFMVSLLKGGGTDTFVTDTGTVIANAAEFTSSYYSGGYMYYRYFFVGQRDFTYISTLSTGYTEYKITYWKK